MTLAKELHKALKEIGPIEPWWSEKDGLYVFEHAAYPMVDYAHSDPVVVKERYQAVLKEFIQDRLLGNVAEVTERLTSGRGGYRVGAGRPKGTTKVATVQVRLPEDVAHWLKADKSHIDAIRNIMQDAG